MDIHIQRCGFMVSWGHCLRPASLQLPSLHLLWPHPPHPLKQSTEKNSLPWSSIPFTASSLLGQASSIIWTHFCVNLLICLFYLAVSGLSYGVKASLFHHMWDLSSLTRDQTCVSCIGRWILNQWTTREVQPWTLFFFWLPWGFTACGFLMLQTAGGLLFTAVHKLIAVACLGAEHEL